MSFCDLRGVVKHIHAAAWSINKPDLWWWTLFTAIHLYLQRCCLLLRFCPVIVHKTGCSSMMCVCEYLWYRCCCLSKIKISTVVSFAHTDISVHQHTCVTPDEAGMRQWKQKREQRCVLMILCEKEKERQEHNTQDTNPKLFHAMHTVHPPKNLYIKLYCDMDYNIKCKQLHCIFLMELQIASLNTWNNLIIIPLKLNALNEYRFIGLFKTRNNNEEHGVDNMWNTVGE